MKTFLVKFITLYLLFLAFFYFSGAKEWYGNKLISSGHYFFNDFAKNAEVKFLKEKRNGQEEIIVGLFNKKQVKKLIAEAKRKRQTKVDYNYVSYEINLWLFPLTALCFLLALALSSPVALKKHLWLLPIAFLLFQLWVWFKIDIDLYYYFDYYRRLELSLLSTSTQTMVNYLYELMNRVEFNIFIALLIWIVVYGRSIEWEKAFPKVAISQ